MNAAIICNCHGLSAELDHNIVVLPLAKIAPRALLGSKRATHVSGLDRES